jgi:hypothetical protein
MKFLQVIWRFITRSWLIAAPLIILVFLFVVVPLVLAVVHAVAARVSGPEAADTLLMDAMTWTWILVMVLTPIALVVYGLVGLVRWLLSERKP